MIIGVVPNQCKKNDDDDNDDNNDDVDDDTSNCKEDRIDSGKWLTSQPSDKVSSLQWMNDNKQWNPMMMKIMMMITVTVMIEMIMIIITHLQS